METQQNTVIYESPELGQYIQAGNGTIYVPFKKQDKATTAHVAVSSQDGAYSSQGFVKTVSEDVAMSGITLIAVIALGFFITRILLAYFRSKSEMKKYELDSERERRRQEELYRLLSPKRQK